MECNPTKYFKKLISVCIYIYIYTLAFNIQLGICIISNIKN